MDVRGLEDLEAGDLEDGGRVWVLLDGRAPRPADDGRIILLDVAPICADEK